MRRVTFFHLFSKLPSLGELDRRLTAQWDYFGDPEAAAHTALEMGHLLKIKAGKIDLGRDFWYIAHAAEVLWDSLLLDEAKQLVELWRQTVEEVEGGRRSSPAAPRIWAAVLSARLEHRRRNYGVAVGYAHQAISAIRSLAGGEGKLRAMLHRGEANEITELYCAAVAIGIPAGRIHFAARPTLRFQFLDHWVVDAQLLLDRDVPPRLHRIHALVIQTFFAIAEEPRSLEREAWLDRLERLDDRLRPATPRAKATKRLRSIARARFDGDGLRERTESMAALEDLGYLPRHVETLTANNWWTLPLGR